MVSKADGLNTAEIREDALGLLGGSKPPSIRKRGYHRALKRGELWAVSQKATQDMINNVIVDLYCPVYNAYVLTNNPLLGLSRWLPATDVKDFFGPRNIVPIRLSSSPKISLWSRIKSWLR